MMTWLSDNGLLLGLAVLDGLASAASIFMVAVGLNLVFGVLRILNVAHGSLYAIGAYTAASITLFLTSHGLPAWLSFPALVLAAALVGVILGPLIERVLLKRVEKQEPVLQFLVTFALFMILEDVQKLIWGVQPVSNDTPMRCSARLTCPSVRMSFPSPPTSLFVLPGIALFTLVGLAWFMRRTLTGRVIVAVTTDREAATSQGIDSAKITMLTFTFGAMLAALGGALASPMSSWCRASGVHHRALLRRGGDGGAGADRGRGHDAAVMIGLGRSIAVYLEPELEVVVPYLIMVLVLLVRPQGLFGVTETRRV
jgi:branched-chain amino acid transport system permease protein